MKALVLTALVFAACDARLHAPLSDLASAARNGDAAQIKQLAAAGADLNAFSGGNSWTPLLHAVHTHQNASVAALLAAGADPNRSPDGNTPLMFAAGYGYDDTVKLLLQHGAKTDGALDWALTGVTDIDRLTWFQCQDSTVRLLHGADPRATASAGSRRWAKLKRCATT